MAKVNIHPSVDNGVKKGSPNFAGGTLTCHCAKDPVAVKIKGDVAHNHACGCTKCWKPKGAVFAVVGVVPRDNVSVSANGSKLKVVDDKATIQAMTARLKEHVPQLVTIAVSQHRDVLDMVWLINHGQIFRFLRKPLSAGRCAISLQAALQHHRMLLKNPELVKRHEVDATPETTGGVVDGVLAKLKSIKRLWV